jgi:hypothetical protein
MIRFHARELQNSVVTVHNHYFMKIHEKVKVKLCVFLILVQYIGELELHIPATLPVDNETLIHFCFEGGWVPEPVWMWRREEKCLPLLGVEPHSSSPQPLTQLNAQISY